MPDEGLDNLHPSCDLLRCGLEPRSPALSLSHILLVEDEPVIRQQMAESLGEAGFEVTATCTGDEAAILLADRDRFDALLTDVTMPGSIDGIGLAEHAREIHPDLPVLFVSGRPSNQQRAEQLAAPTGFMHKPFQTHELIGMVRRLIEA